MRTYELVFVVDPHLTDEEVVQLTGDYKAMIESGGGAITREESWGKRSLAYPIRKMDEGQYVVLYIETDEGSNPFPTVEQRMRQNDKVLRYLTVRTDAGRRRGAGAPAAPPPVAEIPVSETPAVEAGGAE